MGKAFLAAIVFLLASARPAFAKITAAAPEQINKPSSGSISDSDTRYPDRSRRMRPKFALVAAALFAFVAISCEEATPERIDEIKKAVNAAIIEILSSREEKFAGEIQVTKAEVIQHYGDSRRSARDAGTTYVIQVSASLKDGTKSAILTGRCNVFIADSDKWADAQLEMDTLKLAEPELAPVAAPQRLRAISTFPAEALRGWADPVGTDVDTSTKFPSRIRRLKDKAEMVLIPAGTFQMGAVPGDELAEESERPRHKVTLTNAYYMDVNEVTVDQWKLFVSAVKKPALGVWQAETPGDEPIFLVDHRAATEYGAWASAELPTEAQWERAAKGGQDDNVYPWGKVDIADRRSVETYSMVKVRSYVPNAYGLYDMAGNAKEWCADYYDASYYARSPDTDPTGAASGEERVVRSGSNYSRAVNRMSARSSFRGRGVSNRDLGFRLSRTL